MLGSDSSDGGGGSGSGSSTCTRAGQTMTTDKVALYTALYHTKAALHCAEAAEATDEPEVAAEQRFKASEWLVRADKQHRIAQPASDHKGVKVLIMFLNTGLSTILGRSLEICLNKSPNTFKNVFKHMSEQSLIACQSTCLSINEP